jgi:hypothetical protein
MPTLVSVANRGMEPNSRTESPARSRRLRDDTRFQVETEN